MERRHAWGFSLGLPLLSASSTDEDRLRFVTTAREDGQKRMAALGARSYRGDLFGATLNSKAYEGASGGTNGYGTIFELKYDSGTITTLANFTAANGGVHDALYVDSSGDLYGTTEGGGKAGDGTIFELVQGRWG